MTRREELEAKGWPKLNGAERKELQALKGSDHNDAPKNGQMESITMSKTELQELIAEAIKKEREGNTTVSKGTSDWQPYKGLKKRQYTATLRKYREDSEQPFGLIVDWWLHKYDRDEVTGRLNIPIYNFKLRFSDGSTKVIKLALEELTRMKDYEKVKILKQDKQTLVQKQGEARRKVIVADGYISDIPVLGDHALVDLNVFQDVYTCTIETPSGEVFELPADRLNA